jgi:hypothetical protein
MAESALLELVGNDPRKADELTTVIAGLVLSFLTDERLKGEGCAKHEQQNQGSTFKPFGNCLHTSVNFDTGASQP